jgi:hypothetical protein
LTESEIVRVIPIQFARIVLGLLAMFFGYTLGRVAVRLYESGQPVAKAFTWVLRTSVAVVAILWTRGFDTIGIVLLSLTALSIAAGVYLEIRPKKVEEIHLFSDK